MDSVYLLCTVILFGTVNVSVVLAQQHRPCDGNCDQACYFEFSKYDANAFLSSGKRSTPRECCHETYCEQQGVKFNFACTLGQPFQTEQYRALIAKKYTCPPGQVVGVTNWCVGHYAHTCTDPCTSIQVDRCENGGTCIPQGTAWTCSCRPGFEGVICSIDINECATVTCNTTTSYGCIDMVNDYRCDCKGGYVGKDCMTDIDECLSSPCQNSGTCKDHVDGYTCSCSAGFTGTWCEQDLFARKERVGTSNSFSFVVFEVQTDWNTSKDVCEARSGQLFVPGDLTEELIVENHLQTMRGIYGDNQMFWIGGTVKIDVKPPMWLDNNTLNFQRWSWESPPGQSSTMCMGFLSKQRFVWQMFPCDMQAFFICKERTPQHPSPAITG